MLVDLLQPVEAFDSDGTVIKNKEKVVPTLKEIILIALRLPLQSDQGQGLKEKQERFLVIKRLNAADSIELGSGEIKQILERVAKVHQQVEIVGRVAEILTPEETPAPLAAVTSIGEAK